MGTTPPSRKRCGADVVVVLVPDMDQPRLFKETVAPLKPGSLLLFAHGFGHKLFIPEGVDVAQAPKAWSTR